jgi:dolichol-phosphate mannosyltransferase
MSPELSVVVPFYNESANVVPLAEQILRALDKHAGGIELVFVDDFSTDDTWQRILEASRTEPRLRPVRHLRNAGQSAALWTGFKNSRSPIIATLDGDLQNDPADLPGMLARLTDCDMVTGVRTKRADNLLRRISTRVARQARKLALGMDFADTACNLRVFRRSVLETIPAFDSMHRFMPILAHNAGAVVKEMAVTHHPRTAGRSKYGLWNRLGRGIRDLRMVRWYLKRQIRRVPVETPRATA